MTDSNHDGANGHPRGRDRDRDPAMDEVSAHLDRGWDLIEQGDLDGAREAAARVFALEADSPEAHTLLGAVAAATGDADGAIAEYEKAMELDPEYVDPLLYAAETHLWPRCDYDAAIRLCDEALAVAEEEDEYIDALLLKAEAQIANEDDVGARATLADLPPVDYPEPVYHLRAGRSWLDLEQLDAAQRELERALARDPDLVDARHALAMVHEERGDLKRMVELYLKVREADLREPPPPWGVPTERFEALAEEALAQLPERIRELIENVPVVCADYPPIELVVEGNDPRMMGFFAGVPYPEKSTLSGQAPHLDHVFLYQRNIERMCQTKEEVEEEIRKTILHETGHFFGLSEEELEEMGLG